MTLDAMIGTAIAALDLQELELVEESIKSRRAQIIQQRIISIPLYGRVRFQTPQGWVVGVVMRHLKRSVMVDVDDGSPLLRRVDFDVIDWRDFGFNLGDIRQPVPPPHIEGNAVPQGDEAVSRGGMVGGSGRPSLLPPDWFESEAGTPDPSSPV